MTSATEYMPYSDYNLHDISILGNDEKAISSLKTELNKENTYSVVVPAYNEEKRIRPFLEHLKRELPEDWEVIVICDGNDNTANIVKSIDSRFKVMEFEHRLGKGGAIKAGLSVASGNVLGYVDADGAIPVSEVLKVFGSIDEDIHVAVGSRWVRGSKLEKRQPIMRIILGRLYHYMSFALLGLAIKDTQCGVKAFKSEIVKDKLKGVTLKNLSFDTALLYHCQKSGAKIAELPIVWSDVKGSKIRPIKTALVMFVSLVGIKIANSRKLTLSNNLLEAVRDLIENA